MVLEHGAKANDRSAQQKMTEDEERNGEMPTEAFVNTYLGYLL